MVRFGTRGRDQQSHRAGSCLRQQERASLVSSEALVSVTRPNPKGEANALECNNRRVVPPPQPEHGPSHESRDRGHACSVPILVIVLLAMHTVPLTIG